MKFLGIDYGTKRVGTALSDSDGSMAFPHAVIPNDKKLILVIKEICKKKMLRRLFWVSRLITK